MTHAVLNAMIRPLIEPRLPGWVEAEWFTTPAELLALAPRAEIGWFDLWAAEDMVPAIEAAAGLRWLNTVYTGVDWMPQATLMVPAAPAWNSAIRFGGMART